jgi:uncharacterized protein YdeI (YjbR/CyaY-like superfamily)
MPSVKKANPPPTNPVKRFEAVLERMRSRLNWVIIRVPFDAGKAFGKRGQINVKGEINGFPFCTALFPDGAGGHILLVNKRMQKEGHATVGRSAQFRLELNAEQRVAAVPDSLQLILRQHRSLSRWFDQLNRSTRNEIAKWVSAPQSAAAGTRRAEQIAERLMETMEAEKELPPLLQLAFARNPQAGEGWSLMSAARRRSHLLAIFYSRTPEARVRRTTKMLEDAIAIAERANTKKGPK